ncbi:T9SS type A sorting domain-containing protein [Fibrobacter sp. UWB11]|uniref:T9SS type A sorting domain-containing protein n=1 Tax=Fibrobacter sp. UWB11 TaxID=1896202 RepID=UPI0009291052|nr:T9SS type A sorting domain-containing protein [Fibrobacter sp. UWB11]SIO41312.1 Por secretion system C-terminal sorting domain-containing protein [Fibrobacter sp. UWB11]
MKTKRLSFVTAACAAALCSTSFAYTISGTVSDDNGQAIKDVDVSLLKEGKTAKTDSQGKFTIHEDEEEVAIHPAYKNSVGYVNINNGILSYSQSSTSPVQVKIYNSLGNQVFEKKLQGSGTYDLSKGLNAKGTYFAQVSVGNAKQNFKFTTEGNYGSSFGTASALMKDAQKGEAIQFVATDYDTLTIALNTLDTTLNVKLTKTVPPAPTFKFGYALKNEPTPSKGCGTTSKLQKTKSVENGDRFEMRVGSDNREYFITLPKNYDNKKPYKLLFAMHCMGSNAEDFVHHYADQDHPSPYYGQQKLDTEGNYIFVSPRGDTDGMPWSVSSDKDHKFINQLLTTLEENYCIDTSRVFMTGFSFGAMVTNSMAQDMQDRLRAVAVYATADYNIYLPKNKGLPIAWMAVHGKNDGTCQYNRARDSALKRILKNNGKADAEGNFTDASAEKPKEVGGSGHLCYDFTTVDERFPVKFCSWNGQHQWTAYDNGNWQNTWVPQEVHKFFEQF